MKLTDLLTITLWLMTVSCMDNHKEQQMKISMADSTVIRIQQEEFLPKEITLEKDFLYNKHTLEDTVPYKKGVHIFQWDKIKAALERLDSIQNESSVSWGYIFNRKNRNGEAPLVSDFTRNKYGNVQDAFGVERYESIPLFLSKDSLYPGRYERDGSLVKLLSSEEDSCVHIETAHIGGNWFVPRKYIKKISLDSLIFRRVIFVDRTNQNIATMEFSEGKWLIRSMNPATTGLHKPPYQKETPLGIFVIQEKKAKMQFYVDGTTEIGGFAPYANRFCNGGYIHGVPVNFPRKELIEYSATLGTTPRSHMCVRNATSHAEFVFNWAPVEQSLVFIIE